MAYDPNNLSALAYANGFTLWHYRTSDSEDDILDWPRGETGSYFSPASDMLRKGDVIFYNTCDATSYITVSENKNGRVFVQ